MAFMRSILQNYFEIAEPKIEAKHKSFLSEVNQLAYLSHQVKFGKENPISYKKITKIAADIT